MFNTDWNESTQACFEDWHMNFKYLKYLPTYHLYLGMIGLAESVNHLDSLYKMLPSDLQLLRDDWKNLVAFWKRHFRDKRCINRKPLNQWLLYEQSITWDQHKLTDLEADPYSYHFQASSSMSYYYAYKIKMHSTKWSCTHFNNEFSITKWRILSDIGCSGNGYSHFISTLFDCNVSTSFLLNRDLSHVLVRFKMKAEELDNPLTHKVTSILPPYCLQTVGVSRFSTVEGDYLHLSFEFEIGELCDYITPTDNQYYMIIKNGFEKAVMTWLQKHSIPVTRVIPILPI